MKLQVPFLQLPVSFDAQALAHEIAQVDESHWRPHPNKLPGNSALTLIATNGEPDNDDLAGDMRPTPVLEQLPRVKEVLSALGATWGRSRLMRLSGQAEVTAHVDTNYYWRERMRVHVPVTTTPDVRFQVGDAETNMKAGECWIFDTWSRHRVINGNDSTRIHLVADTVGGAGLWDLISRGRPAGRSIPGWQAPPAPLPITAISASSKRSCSRRDASWVIQPRSRPWRNGSGTGIGDALVVFRFSVGPGNRSLPRIRGVRTRPFAAVAATRRAPCAAGSSNCPASAAETR